MSVLTGFECPRQICDIKQGGVRALENRGERKCTGRQQRPGLEMEVLKGWRVGEIGENFTTMLSQGFQLAPTTNETRQLLYSERLATFFLRKEVTSNNVVNKNNIIS